MKKISFDNKLNILARDNERLYQKTVLGRSIQGLESSLIYPSDIEKWLDEVYDETYNAFKNIIEKHGAYISGRSLKKICKFVLSRRELYRKKLLEDEKSGLIIIDDWKEIENELMAFEKRMFELAENIQNAVLREKRKEAWNNRIPTIANIALTFINILLTALGIYIQFLLKNNTQ